MSWREIVKDVKEGPRQEMWMDEKNLKETGYTYFQNKADKMQSALKVLQWNFKRLEEINAKEIPHGIKDDPDFYMGKMKEAFEKIDSELIEMETYVEKLRTDTPWNPNIARVSGTDLMR